MHEIWQAETGEQAHCAFDMCLNRYEGYEAKYPKATLTLQKDRDELKVSPDFLLLLNRI